MASRKKHSECLPDFSVFSAMKFRRTKIQHEVRGEAREKHRGNIQPLFYLALALICCSMIFNFACTPRALEKPKAIAPSNENKTSDFEADLQTMKTAGFEQIFVFRRKDGAAFDGEDRKYLRGNAPAETNRFVATDNGKAFVAGSKYPFPPASLDALRIRFNVEDYSPPKAAK